MKSLLEKVQIPSNVWLAIAIIALVIGLILIIAFLKRIFQNHEKHYGIWSGMIAGFILAFVLEGFLLMNGKNLPTPVQSILISAIKDIFNILKIPISCLN